MEKKEQKTYTFVSRSNLVHDNKYDYSKTVYINTRTNVTITCPVHGDFEQNPYSHLKGSGCSACYFDSKKLTQEQFIVKAKEIHGDKYDYSKVIYKVAQDKVIVTCPEHGDFLVRSGHHIYEKQGCRACFFESKKSDISDIIKRANEIHDNKYDYSKTVYVLSHEKITVICPEHDEFEIDISNHLRGAGCQVCARLRTIASRKSDTEEFITRSKEIHGGKYDYTEVEYKDSKTLVAIGCAEHGEFKTTPERHLAGVGCQICSKVISGVKRRSNTEEFITRAKEIHDDKYDYSKVDYITDRTAVTIICPIHGEFTKKPCKHLAGQGCQKCSIDKLIKSQSHTTEKFIAKAKEIHGDRYDYSKVDYINNATKVTIICKKHGEFKQIPQCHLAGSGCSLCKASKGEIIISNILSSNGIEYQIEFKPPESVTRHRYDFYLPDFKLLIEFHGIQHYKAIEYFGGLEALKETKFRDAYKKSFAKLAGYAYLEFNYKQLKHLTQEKFEQLVIRSINRFKKLT